MGKLFNKDEFKASLENTPNTFKEINSGVYDIELEQIAIKRLDSGTVQCNIGFSISDDDPNFAGQWFFRNITMTNKDGEANGIGRVEFNSLMMQFSESMFDLDAFLENEDELQKFVGTRLKAKVTKVPSKDPQYGPSYKIKPMTILENIYTQKAGTPNPSPSKQVNNQITQQQEVEVDLKIGMFIAWQPTTGGAAKEGKVISFIEQTGQIVVQNTRGATDVISADQVSAIIQEKLPEEEQKNLEEFRKDQAASTFKPSDDNDLDLEEDSSSNGPVLKVGGKIAFSNKGQRYEVIVTSIDENEGKVGFELNNKNFKLPIDKVEVLS